MKKIIDGIWDVPWNIGKEIKKTNQLKNNLSVIFEHVLREGNTVADYLANFVFSCAGTTVFHSFHDFPSVVKTLMYQDKA